ncbi:MAG: hypothetical protein GY870_07070 [archaeon]|nr:hypothetical protein [archaeon]
MEELQIIIKKGKNKISPQTGQNDNQIKQIVETKYEQNLQIIHNATTDLYGWQTQIAMFISYLFSYMKRKRN